MKKLPEFSHLHAFLHVAKKASFVNAAKELNLTPASITSTIRGLEDNLGIRLFNRSTRSVSLTNEGELLLNLFEPIYMDYLQAIDQLQNEKTNIQGQIKLNIPRIIQQLFFKNIILPFQQHYPAITLELVISDHLINIIDEGCDFGVRYFDQISQDMVAIPFGQPVGLITVASPKFIETYGQPDHYQHLVKFNCIQRRFPSGRYYHWEFMENGRLFSQKVKGNLILDDDQDMIEAAMHDLAIAYVYEELAQPYLQQGKLVKILQNYQCPKQHFYLYYPNKKYMANPSKTWINWLMNYKS